MDWKENGTGYQGKEGEWSAYIKQDNVACMWKVFKSGVSKGAGFSDNIAISKQKVQDVIDKG